MRERELLKEYVEQASQPAFAGLIERYSGLVYSTCLRELGDEALAEDVTQVVFLLLAERAASIRESTGLSSWLFQTACLASKNALKQELRRRQREQKAAEEMMREQQLAGSESGWEEIKPFLNDALRRLKEEERQAILLRFFAGKSLLEVGQEIGISEEAARKRVARAVEKMRQFFARHGLMITVPVLVGLVSANAVKAAPARCVQALLSASAYGAGGGAIAGSGAVSGSMATAMTGTRAVSLWQGVSKALLLGKVYVALGSVAGIGFVCAGVGGAVHFQKTLLAQSALAKPSTGKPIDHNRIVHKPAPTIAPVIQPARLAKRTLAPARVRPQPIPARPGQKLPSHYSLPVNAPHYVVSPTGAAQLTVAKMDKGTEMIRTTHPMVRPTGRAVHGFTPVKKVNPAFVAKAVIPLLSLLPVQQVRGAAAAPWSLSVVGKNGKPVKARVRINRIFPDQTWQMETDAAGHAGGDIKPGWNSRPGSVLIYAPGYAPAGGALRPGKYRVKLGMPHTVSGHVTDDNGKPLAGVTVQMSSIAPDLTVGADASLENSVEFSLLPRENNLFTARTNGEGRYTIQNAPERGTATISVSDAQWQRAKASIDLLEDKEFPDMKTRPAARLSGRVVGPDGAPLAGRIVSAAAEGQTAVGQAAMAETDAEGHYVLGGLTAGKTTIRVHEDPQKDPGIPPLTEVAAVIGAETAAPDIRLEGGAPVEIKTIPAVSDGNFVLIRDGAPRGEMAVCLDINGGVARGRVRPGTYALKMQPLPQGWLAPRAWPSPWVSPSDWFPGGPKVEVAESGTGKAEVHLAPALTVTGVALDEAGKPVAGIQMRNSIVETTTTDAKGGFKLGGFAPGENWIGVGSGWEQAKPQPFTLPATEPVIITLKKVVYFSFRGRVMDDKGAPLKNAVVTADITDWAPSGGGGIPRQKLVRTDADGRYEVTGLRANSEVHLKAAKSKYTFASGGQVTGGNTVRGSGFIARSNGAFLGVNGTLLGVNGAPVPDVTPKFNPNPTFAATDIVLQPLGREAVGRVVDAAGKPVANALVAALAGGQDAYSAARNITRTNAEGRFKFSNLPDGEVSFVAGAGDGFIQVKSQSSVLNDLVLRSQARAVRDTGLAGELMINFVATPNFGYGERTWLTTLLSFYNFQGALAAMKSQQPNFRDEASIKRTLVMQWVHSNPEAARDHLPELLPEIEPENSGRFISFVLDVSRLVPQPERETLPGETANARILRAWVRDQFAGQRARFLQAIAEDARGIDNTFPVAILAPLGARLGEPDAEKWAKSAIEITVRADNERGRPSYNMANIFACLAQGGVTLVEKSLDTVPPDQRVQALGGAIRTLARTDTVGASRLLELLPLQTQSKKSDIETEFNNAAIAIITRMEKRDAGAALALARRVTGDANRPKALALAARLQPAAEAAALSREAFTLALSDTTNRAQPGIIAGMALESNAAAGEELLEKTEDKFFDPQDGRALEVPTFYLAQTQPGRARAWLEWKWAREMAPRPINGFDRSSALTSAVMAMSAVDAYRALEMAAAIPPVIDERGNENTWRTKDAQYNVLTFLVAPESARRRLNTAYWQSGDVWIPDIETD